MRKELSIDGAFSLSFQVNDVPERLLSVSGFGPGVRL